MDGLVVLHGAYAPSSIDPSLPGLWLWAEGASTPRPRGETHPRAVDSEALQGLLKEAGRTVASAASRGRAATGRVVVPAVNGRPMVSAPLLKEPDDYGPPDAFTLRAFEIPALHLSPADALELLLEIADPPALERTGAVLGDDLEYWIEAARRSFALLLRRRVVPTAEDGTLRWRGVVTDPDEHERLTRFADALPPVCRTIGAPKTAHGAPNAFPPARLFVHGFLDDTVDAAARRYARSVVPAERLAAGTPEARLVASLASTAPGTAPEDPETVQKIHEWSVPALGANDPRALRLLLRLTPPLAQPPTGWRLEYLLEAVDDPSLLIPAEDVWGTEGGSLRRLGRRFANPEESLLARLGEVATLSPPIARSLEDPRPTGAELTLAEAHRFLTSDGPALAERGVRVLLPGDGRLASRVGTRLFVRDAGTTRSSVTRFGLDALVEFDWKVAVGDALLSPEEFESLASQKVPLVNVRGAWVLLDPETVARTLKQIDRRPPGRTTLGDVLRLASGLETETQDALVVGVDGEGWVKTFLDPDAARTEILGGASPKTLQGSLRPYQARGVAWLRFLLSRGLGACLADDMGLGKTIQFLATLLLAREAGEPVSPSLLVCPTTVAENWLREAARFAPSLRLHVHHGPARTSGDEFHELLAETDLLVTTYSLAHRDRSLLSDVTWEYMALDEAQNVKNPSAAQSRAVRALKARRRAALTGTPVENRLAELKAIFDVLNPGLLGSDETFREHFALPIERRRDAEAEERLRRLTAPFVLRRTKTDPAIAPDLPEKIETKEIVGLTKEQATLYRAATRALLGKIESAKGKSRRARVLTLLLRLKQVCDHPALFLGDGSRLEGRSAKLTRLLEMLEETHAEGAPSLLFTQFAEMGHLLVKAVKARFNAEVLFLHGGVGRKARGEMVRRFQEDDDPPLFFVLSLKAGGSGLNLTRASHVFHYDRWWNPAVEDQATDRAYRIGQTRNVQVHKFVCRGTLEERIDKMIEEKRALARSIVSTGESWIADLTNDELSSLVALSPEAVDGSGGAS